MKLLVLRFSSIGDIVLTTPVVRALKTQLDEAEVHYATKKQYAPLLAENPYVDKVHVLEDSLVALLKELDKEGFDAIIDLHHNLRTLLIKTALRKPSFSFDKINFRKWLFVNFKWDRLPNLHIVDRYMACVAAFGIKKDSLGLDYFIPDKDQVENDWLPPSHQQGFVAVVIGAKFATKQLPFNRLIELCDRINNPIILLGGPEDTELGNQIEHFFARSHQSRPYEEVLVKKLGKGTRIFNACGKFNLNQSASLIQQSEVVFSHDTGLMHIAAAFRKKIFSIWGNTTPRFGMYPYKTQFVIFENNKLQCRPCSKIGYGKCPKGHFKCMNELVFDFYLPAGPTEDKP
ncbi:MAG: glycosyltransferase family 9 protein [Cyclobacteriaceae bacterium]|nr:glycosyltransferase family 9 protein [Cyclobacteriaceae bacterium]